MVVVQVFSMNALTDAEQVAASGADHVGTQVSVGNIPYTVDVKLGRQICDAIEASAKSVMIPISRSPSEIREFARLVEPDIIQLANDETMLTRETFTNLIADLRGDGFEVIKVVAVGAGDELETADYYAGVTDYLMLDTFGAPPSELLKGFIGGTGKTSDWKLGRKIVEKVKKPVILAGGLNLENVTAAIHEVKPWGVDAASSLSIPGTRGRKDMDKVRRFVALAKGC
jgi:phosphoribosylanthranilate isomerase